MRKFLALTSISLLLLCFPAYADQSGKGVVSFAEEDGDPETYPWQIKVTNGSLTDNGDGTASLAIGAGGSGDNLTVNTTAIDTTANFKDSTTITHAITDGGAGGPDDVTPSVVLLKDLVTTAPLTGGTNDILVGADSDITIAISDAAADGSTKGASTYTALDFTASSGVISLNKTATLAGNPVLGANNLEFATTGLIFEGATNDNVETLLAVTDPTSTDKTITLPDATGTVAVSATTPITLSATGDIGITVAKDLVTTSPLTGGTDNILVGADSDITIALGDVALTTNTSGNYVTDVTAGVGLAKTSSAGEGQTVDLAIATTEVEATTWGAGGNASNIWTFNVSGTDHTMTIGSGLITFSNAVTVTGALTATLTGTASGNYAPSGTDVAVADGGTGKSAWTQYLIPYADTTTSFSQIAIGTSGQILVSGGAGVAPSFASVSTSSPFTITDSSVMGEIRLYESGATPNYMALKVGAMTSDATWTILQGAALTTQLTTLTYTAPGTPDYAIQDLTAVGGYGFVTKDEGNTVLSVIKNLQDKVQELENRLEANGIVATN